MTKKEEKQQSMEIDLLKLCTSPQGKAAVTLSEITPPVVHPESGKERSLDFLKALQSVLDETNNVVANNLTGVESVLLAQIMVMDTIFYNSVRAAHATQSLEHKATHMNMALKTQSQIRATVEALASIKNPKTYIHQQNMAYQQQVNTGNVLQSYGHPAPIPLAENPKTTNELLTDGGKDYETLDCGGKKAAIGKDKELVAVEKVYGTED